MVTRGPHPTGSEPSWSASGAESDAAVWNRKPELQSNESSDSPIPDPLRPGVTPLASSSIAQDEINPWGDASQAKAQPERPPSTEHTSPVPQSLQPGVQRKETNPFKRKPAPNRVKPQDVPASLSVPSRAPTTAQAPSVELSHMRLSEPETTSNPWQPHTDDRMPAGLAPPAPPNLDQDPSGNVWGSASASNLTTRSNTPATIPMQKTGESTPWDDEILSKPSIPSLPAHITSEQNELADGEHAWDDAPSTNTGKQPAVVHKPNNDNWNLIDHDPMPERKPISISRQSSWENFSDDEPTKQPAKPVSPSSSPPREPAEPAETAETAEPKELEQPPALPPRTNTLPQQQATSSSSRPPPKSETYLIKNINWYDAKIKNTRKSPVLVQNVNGPCPLVALVNALTLTTPHSTTSNLVEGLRTREQVSINFLLEAVIDELMSSGRRDPDANLPDMTELYDFLKGLQTGMNVNPRFLPSDEAVRQYKRTSLGHVHPSQRDAVIPGTFDDTRDMTLYATFSIPLMHGWLPPSDDPVYDAFRRQTASYDDIQTLLFREEELEVKLSTSAEGLTEAEQQLYQDIFTIKAWLSSAATQLTPWGLEVVTKSIQPGGVAILFRNDHFATLYRHPQTLELLTLVTDAGYHKHEEVIWESLVDVRGERSDFYSGDFRVVGGSGAQPSQSSGSDRGSDWQTVQNRRGGNNNSPVQGQSSSQQPTQTEQEDRDLALALQLQEEEDERHRTEEATRRRQSELSEQFIEQQGGRAPQQPPRPGQNGNGRGRGNSGPVNIPVRGGSRNASSTTSSNGTRGGGRSAQQVRSLIPPRTHRPTDSAEDDAPPTYEQASQSAAYTPPAGHPSHAASPNAPRRGSGVSPGMQAGPSSGVGRGRVPNGVPVGNKEEKCAVM